MALIGKAGRERDIGERTIAIEEPRACGAKANSSRMLADGPSEPPPELTGHVHRMQIEFGGEIDD